jgi:hypothetical protein
LVVDATTCIYATRNSSSDDRITDVSRVELAAYERLVNSKSWVVHLNKEPSSTIIQDIIARTTDLIKELLQLSNDGVLGHCASMFAFASMLQFFFGSSG